MGHSRSLSVLTILMSALLSASWVRAQQQEAPDAAPAYTPGETIDIHRDLSDAEWPQLGNTPQRTNYTPMKFEPAQGVPKWSRRLTDLNVDNKVQPCVQAVVGGGAVYVGCKNGRMFALDAMTGDVRWTYQAGGPILHTAGYANGKVLFACMDGLVYALDAADGKEAWTTESGRRYGFETAVLLAEDKVFAVDCGGRLFALARADGRKLWHYDAGAPVSQSPAWNAARVYFASEDMHVHAVRAADGARLWRSAKLGGLSFRYFHPVVVDGKVIVRSMACGPHLADHTQPALRALFALDEQTGEEAIVLPQWIAGHDGTEPPPSVTRDGLLVVPWTRPEMKKDLVGNSWLGWALQDPKTGDIVLPLLENQRHPMVHSSQKEYNGYHGTVAADENMISSVIGGLVLAVHHHGFRQNPSPNMSGAFDISQRRWHTNGPREKGWLGTPYANQQSGGSNAAVGAGGFIYHVPAQFDGVTCHEPPKEKEAAEPQALRPSPAAAGHSGRQDTSTSEGA